MASAEIDARRDGGVDACANELELLEALKQRLEGMRDLELSAHQLPIVSSQVRARMAARCLPCMDDYLRLLDEAPEERRLLRDALLVGSTSFFRDDDVFATLAGGVVADLRRGHDRPLKVWVPGCSSGEEAYSIAMVLREHLDAHGDARAVRLFATDVRERGVTHGRKGIYGKRACAAVAPSRLARFFEPVGGGSYQVASALRDVIVWGRHNLARDPPLPAMDLVSCRNVLLYFERETQARILAKLHYALRSGGLLLLGAAESTRAAPALFTPVALAIRLYARRTLPHAATAAGRRRP